MDAAGCRGPNPENPLPGSDVEVGPSVSPLQSFQGASALGRRKSFQKNTWEALDYEPVH